ncbi:MAG: hypothetical protein FWE28_06005 [Oscillospiraceae bacterium]|nr:hypothetical protein [Oscillospiraceae bacterium]
MKKAMTEQQKETLIKIYRVYDVVDWIIAITIIATPLLFVIVPLLPDVLQGGGIDEVAAFASLEAFMNSIAHIPPVIIVPIFIVYTMYTIFCFTLYVKVWPIKEIRNRFTYWFDWVLTIGLTVYELFIFYIILFG